MGKETTGRYVVSSSPEDALLRTTGDTDVGPHVRILHRYLTVELGTGTRYTSLLPYGARLYVACGYNGSLVVEVTWERGFWCKPGPLSRGTVATVAGPSGCGLSCASQAVQRCP